jgi:hypothetical protein
MSRQKNYRTGGVVRGTLPRDLTTPAWTDTDPERPDLTAPVAAAQYASPDPIVRALSRTRWAYQGTAEKCDLADAIAAWEELGGRVDRAVVLVHRDGAVTLGPWRELLPEADRTTPPTGSFRTGPAGRANPQDVPTGGRP